MKSFPDSISEAKHLIKSYQQSLAKGSSRTIIDLDYSIEPGFDFQIHRIEDLVRAFRGYMPPNRISHYVIAMIKKGAGEKSVGCFNFDIYPGMALIIPKRMLHSSRDWDLETSGFMLSFNENFLIKNGISKSLIKLSSLFKISRSPHCGLSKEMQQKLESLFEEILDEHHGSRPLKSELTALKTAELIVLYKRIFNAASDEDSPGNLIYERFIDLLEKKFTTEKSVRFYADAINTHPNHLNFSSKKVTGFSAKQHISQRVILEARFLLAASGLSIKEIAFELGFKDQNYFSRYFKRTQKISPLEYRNSFL